jgi:hypothetical protein
VGDPAVASQSRATQQGRDGCGGEVEWDSAAQDGGAWGDGHIGDESGVSGRPHGAEKHAMGELVLEERLKMW